jgi:membrane-bound ClpP family serine protease
MERSAPGRYRLGTLAYWAVAVLFVGFGYLGLLSIGAPFLLTGIALMVVSPWRSRPEVLWPALVGVWAFVLGYVLVAPFGCTSTAISETVGSPRAVSHTTCTNILGIDYSGTGIYNPSLVPALLAGVAAGGAGALATRILIVRRRRTPMPA